MYVEDVSTVDVVHYHRSTTILRVSIIVCVAVDTI